MVLYFVLRVPLHEFIVVVISLYVNNVLCCTEKCERAHNNDFVLDAIWSKSSGSVTVAVPVVGILY
jgi:hypothetical protein